MINFQYRLGREGKIPAVTIVSQESRVSVNFCRTLDGASFASTGYDSCNIIYLMPYRMRWTQNTPTVLQRSSALLNIFSGL